jgi:hypothetical protein
MKLASIARGSDGSRQMLRSRLQNALIQSAANATRFFYQPAMCVGAARSTLSTTIRGAVPKITKPLAHG